jgi:c-di-GMP phosphodiesterase
MTINLTPLLARQPIFDSNLKVVAYELLCRDINLKHITTTDGDAASSQVLLNAFTELSIEKMVGKHKAFINFNRSLLSAVSAFDPKKLVIELLEGQEVDDNLLQSLSNLRTQGYSVALDDFELNLQSQRLVPYADMIKLDVLHLSLAEVKRHIDYLKPFGNLLIAEKVETYEMFEQCRNLGFSWFQGYFLAKPHIITGKKISENKQAVLQLMASLYDPDVTVDLLDRLIASDPLLSFKLLRLVNSAAFGIPRKVDSLRQAIMLLGINKLRNWANLLALSNLGGKPHELCVAALTRARLCEMIAIQMNEPRRADSFFTVGLLSTLDAFLDMPLDRVMQSISISDTLKEAILSQSGQEGMVLSLVKAHEQAHWDEINWQRFEQFHMTPEKISAIYLEVLPWVEDTISSLN